MHVPQWLKPACWGVVVGALGIMILGFAWGGWVLGSTAERMATDRADGAATAVLAPNSSRTVQPSRLHTRSRLSLPLPPASHVSSLAPAPGTAAARTSLGRVCGARPGWRVPGVGPGIGPPRAGRR